MAAVPSAGCLLAKNHFYRTRLNSASSSSSSSSFQSCCDLAGDQEKMPVSHGIQVPFDKCWWMKKFFTCEVVSLPVTEPTTMNSASS
ncbi:pancreatic progenitor cell differentiation and proliferation factor-like protein [Brienomyrus brachyistius]|uniref:pancreatic progenitor cell differentiation and proliferation factor-like protein n=1 Tax=Brienomyrus brachyistius TaxID=42636 RepID=UPI0020B411BF|nr:pancreatic progenitor cell differentiation and proliferation factor-like protein [Brienomyrus brachyistius]